MRILNPIVDLPHPFNKIGDGPEGAEVARVADALHNILAGKTIRSVSITEKGTKNHNSLSQIDFPSTIVKISSKGKKILIYTEQDVSDPKLRNEVLIANSLMMSGYWSLEADNYIRFTLTFAEIKPIHFCSIRGFSRTHVFKTEDGKEEYLNKIGPDLLRDVIISEEWLERMRRMTIKRKGSRPFLICDALIEQKIFSGAGNYVRADAMYKARIRPNRPVASLSDDELERLRIAVCDVIRCSYKSEGYTIRDFKHVDGRPGRYEPVVYGREKDKLGNDVVRERFSESKHKNRTVHWVPKVQDSKLKT